MTEQDLTPAKIEIDPQIISNLVLQGDVSQMSPTQKTEYYRRFCEALGLNPLTQPFKILRLNGKEQLYATKDCTEQLRKLHGVSIESVKTDNINGVFIVTASAKDKTGRLDSSVGAVTIEGLKGDALANALMKAETKAKRRVTLSICGMGILDETELETIPGAQTIEKSADNLKYDYLTLLDQLEQITGGYDSKMLPDNWKQEQNIPNFLKAISHVSKLIDDEKEVRRGTLTPHTIQDMKEKVADSIAKDDFYVDERKGKKQ